MSTNSETTANARAFRETDEFIEGGHRRLTIWAVAAAALGLAASLALVSPLLWVVPLAAVAFGLIALKTIRDSEDALAGGKLAMLGIGLAVVFLSWAMTSYWMRGRLLYAQAQGIADEWFDLVKDRRLEEAHQLRRNYVDRAPSNIPLEQHYRESNAREMLAGFTREPVVEKIALLGDDARLTFQSNVYVTSERANLDAIAMRYLLESISGKEPPTVVEVELTREAFSGVGESRWTIRRIDFRPIK
ncbi:MAG: hypothetical protein U0939_19695 [Pirellulales bacterium]